MVEKTALRYASLKSNARTGRLEWWFRRGKAWTLLPGDPGMEHAAAGLYWKLRSGSHNPPVARPREKLIASHRLTPRFLSLKPGSRKIYEYRQIYIEAKNRVVPEATFRRGLFNAAKAAADCSGCMVHGRRKNATVGLIEAGCSEDEAMAITGYASSNVVRHYGRGARRKVLAKHAWEQGK